eukprot:scaffold144992_cov127-Phaeocystis_antarctica.AAC.1
MSELGWQTHRAQAVRIQRATMRTTLYRTCTLWAHCANCGSNNAMRNTWDPRTGHTPEYAIWYDELVDVLIQLGLSEDNIDEKPPEIYDNGFNGPLCGLLAAYIPQHCGADGIWSQGQFYGCGTWDVEGLAEAHDELEGLEEGKEEDRLLAQLSMNEYYGWLHRAEGDATPPRLCRGRRR